MHNTEGTTVSAAEARRKASRHVLEELGDRLWVGEAVYDEARQSWTVPIHARALPDKAVVGAVTMDRHGNALQVTSREEVLGRITELRSGLAVRLQRAEEWLWNGAEWALQGVRQLPMRFQALTGGPALAQALGESAQTRPLVGGSVSGSDLVVTGGSAAPLRLELNLYLSPGESPRVQAVLFEGDRPARRAGQRLTLSPQGGGPDLTLELGFGGAFEATEGSADPLETGLPADCYTLVLRIPSADREYRFGEVNVTQLAHALVGP
jgi:hypothetical protein